MPQGADQKAAVSRLAKWARERKRTPLLFGIEPADLLVLDGWSVREIGRQPLFRASKAYCPSLSGSEQPAFGREIRRQARRALAKHVSWQEVTAGQVWQEHDSGALTQVLLARWQRQPLAEFSFLVALNLSSGQQFRRYFLLLGANSHKPLGMAIVLKSGRGWLIEHQLMLPQAPNGSGELLLCQLLASYLDKGELLSLGITPLYRALIPDLPHKNIPAILSFMPARLREWLVAAWEPLYGFRRLQSYREKLEPVYWEPVYWASYGGSPAQDLLAVLRVFAGGSILRFVFDSMKKLAHKLSLRFDYIWLTRINTLYILSLCLWVPILWFLDERYLFGSISSPKAWAIYDLALVFGFVLHFQDLKAKKLARTRKPSGRSYLVLGLVLADAILSFISTGLYLQGQNPDLILVLWLSLINIAPWSAVVFIAICCLQHVRLLRSDSKL